MSEPSDEQLLRTARERPEALGEFYDRYEPAVMAYFMRRASDPHAALDFTAETFAEVVLQCHKGVDIENAAAWLFSIARSKLSDAHRRGSVDARARRRIGLARIDVVDEQIERIEAMGDELSAQIVHGALADLSDEHRSAVIARVVEEEPYPTIAAAAGTSEQVIRQRVSRGLAALRTRLGALLP